MLKKSSFLKFNFSALKSIFRMLTGLFENDFIVNFQIIKIMVYFTFQKENIKCFKKYLFINNSGIFKGKNKPNFMKTQRIAQQGPLPGSGAKFRA